MGNTKFAALASIWIAKGIALGAIAAHLLKNHLSVHYLQVFETGAKYQIYAGLGLLILSLQTEGMKYPLRMLFAGSFIFSVSLYLLALNELISPAFKIFGAVAPIGGLLMIAAWCVAAYLFWKNKNK